MGQGLVKKQRSDYICTYPQPDYSLFTQNTKQWMKLVDDDKYISSLTIPGTHQSISLIGGCCLLTVAQCQSWNIETQLNCGIRCFDLRGKCKKESFLAYHGIINQNLDLSTVFPVFYKFLEENPSEFIIIQIKEEDNSTGDEVITQMFDKLISEEQKKKYWLFQNQIPKVQDVRGKIFFMPRWGYGQGYTTAQTQDMYNVKPERKVQYIEEFRQKTLQCSKQDKGQVLYMNYLSGATVQNWPLTYAKKGNGQFYDNCESKGIIMMDFPGEKLIDKIIKLNNPNMNEYSVLQKKFQQGSPLANDRQYLVEYVEVK